MNRVKKKSGILARSGRPSALCALLAGSERASYGAAEITR
jgi:hypothetical protein